jgi:hypothetical protein
VFLKIFFLQQNPARVKWWALHASWECSRFETKTE